MARVLSLLYLCLCLAALALAAPQPIEADPVVNYAKERLSRCGTLRKDEAGLVFLDVDPSYVAELYPVLLSSLPLEEVKNVCQPRGPRFPAHFNVIYRDELPKPIKSFPEGGRRCCFSPQGVTYLASNDPGVEGVYVLRVSSLQLMKVRRNYGLTIPPHGVDFYIVIGVVYR
jgi:hypothetical protein